MKFKCKLYGTSEYPEVCKGYPWNDSNLFFKNCIFVSGDELLTEEEVLQSKTQEEIQEYCKSCWKCCLYWENGRPLNGCTALVQEEDQPLQ